MNQTDTIIIKNRVNELIDSGIKNRFEIYTKIVEEFGTPRPTVRRIVRELKDEMMEKVKVLESEPEITGRGNKV